MIAHVLFCLSFVVVTVKARLSGMDYRLEQAAMDLYATEWQTFRLVTLPLAMPGIVAAAMLSFSLSFDDFIVSNFTAGQSVTFPLYRLRQQAEGLPAPAVRRRHADVPRLVRDRDRRNAVAPTEGAMIRTRP